MGTCKMERNILDKESRSHQQNKRDEYINICSESFIRKKQLLSIINYMQGCSLHKKGDFYLKIKDKRTYSNQIRWQA